MAWSTQKDFPFKAAFTYHIRRLQEIGAVDRYLKNYEAEDQFCPNVSGKSLTMRQCAMAFLVFIGGLGGCIIILLLERWVSGEWINWFLNCRNHNFEKLLTKPGTNSTTTIQIIQDSHKIDEIIHLKDEYKIKVDLLLRSNHLLKRRVAVLAAKVLSLKASNEKTKYQ